jgi:hypothetical protein
MECEGNCERHEGRVRCVWVYDSLKDWGPFYYCDVAVQHDIARGLKVVECSNNEVEQQI